MQGSRTVGLAQLCICVPVPILLSCAPTLLLVLTWSCSHGEGRTHGACPSFVVMAEAWVHGKILMGV